MTQSHDKHGAVDARRLEAARAAHAEAISGLAPGRDGFRLDCETLEAAANNYNSKRCAAKVNSLPHFGDHVHTGCRCSGGSDERFKADLIVLIDTSGSMDPHAASVSAAAEAGIRAARERCNVDLRIAFMGVEGTYSGTVFATDHLAYLKALHNPDPAFATDSPPRSDFHANREEGANAVEDLSRFYDWRRDSCRAIFYISDEDLDSWMSTPAEDTAAVNSAVAAAQANKVTVFAHLIPSISTTPKTVQDYKDLTEPTGGRAFINATPSVAEYEEMLAEAICSACGVPRCQEAPVPELEPCISVSWGDSRCDCFETDDTEIVCITVCNCYSNISFTNFRIAGVIVVDENGNAVPTLPDGTPSVEIVPLGPVCFGEIPPCRDEAAGCVSREYVLRTRGARAGRYQVQLIGICYDVVFHYNRNDVFELTLCADR